MTEQKLPLAIVEDKKKVKYDLISKMLVPIALLDLSDPDQAANLAVSLYYMPDFIVNPWLLKHEITEWTASLTAGGVDELLIEGQYRLTGTQQTSLKVTLHLSLGKIRRGKTMIKINVSVSCNLNYVQLGDDQVRVEDYCEGLPRRIAAQIAAYDKRPQIAY